MIRKVSFAALAVLGALGCDAEPYCLNCVPIDGSVAGSYDVRPVEVIVANPDACMPTNGGTEACDGRDNNCNGRIDEGFDLTTDPRHCGRCNARCELPFALPSCVGSLCQIRQCDIGHLDLDRNPTNGCEYECTPTGATEMCDGRDNNCNGLIDEGFDLQTNASHCGQCNNACRFDAAEAACVAGTCRLGTCNAGAIDLDRSPANGCEYRCTRSGPEVCDGRDNDCDGTVDNGVNLNTDVANCGACNRACPALNATPTCVMGQCRVGTCRAGWADLNGDVSDGCEWQCGALDGTRGPEVCDGRDNDCNGLIDDGAVAGVGEACGPGVCRTGRQACESGTLRCVGAPTATLELCNGRDDDCDGMVDEAPTGGSLPGTGPTAFCGNDVGACTYGRFTCVSGRIECVGGTGPGAEVCDGVDNDCDGSIDEGVAVPTGFRCNTRGAEGVGACAGATPYCAGARGWTCNYGATYRNLDEEALCDGIDNNCDGRLDEGCLTNLSRTDVRLDGGNANTIQPMIHGGGNNVGVVYIDRRSGEADVYFTRSVDGGQSWLTERRLDTNVAGRTSSVQPWLSWVNGGTNLIAAWGDFRTSGQSYRQVFTSSSVDSGGNWSLADVRANTGQNNDSFNIQVHQTSTTFVAVWETFFVNRGRHIYAAVSTDRGGSWRAVSQLDTAPNTAVASTPDVAVAGSRVFVVWRDNRSGRPDIYFRGSPDGGLTWTGSDVRLDTDLAGEHTSEEPSVAADLMGNVFVAWQDVRDGRAYDIYFQRSGDNGARWLTSDVRVDVDPFPRDSLHPNVMAVGNGDAGVVWQDFRWGLPNPYGNRTVMGGSTFQPSDAQVIGGMPGRSSAVNVASSNAGAAVIVAWADNRNGSLDIYANYSLDGGATYQPTDLRFDTAPNGVDAHYPTVFAASVGGRPVFHAAWVDRRTNGINGDIYYRALR